MENLKLSYDAFINQMQNLYPFDNSLSVYVSNDDGIYISRIKHFNNSLNTTTKFNYFLKKKIKLFSHKDDDTLTVSQSLFGSSMPLKKIFNNQEENIKDTLWNCLHDILLQYNLFLNTPTSLERAELIKNNVKQKESSFNPKESLNKILNTDNLNESTNNLINDIFGEFEKAISDKSENPLGNLYQITQNITEKYKDKIENGDIKLDNLLGNMTKLPGMEKMGGMVEMLTSKLQGEQIEPHEKVVMDENFSTSNVELGVLPDEQNSNMTIGSILQTVDNFGFMNGQLPNMDILMDVFSKIGDNQNQEELNQVFEKELGIDMNKFTQEMNKMLQKE